MTNMLKLLTRSAQYILAVIVLNCVRLEDQLAVAGDLSRPPLCNFYE